MELAQDQLNKGKNNEVMQVLLKIVTVLPNNHKTYFLLGMTHYQTGNNFDIFCFQYINKGITKSYD